MNKASRMSDRDHQILKIFAAKVRQHFPAARIWAFGSRARGDATWESDLDVCLVLDQCDRHIDHLIDQIAWEVGFEHELIIMPICFSSEEFEHGPMSASTLVMNIVREGIAA
jgi:predicted nucleotidyltransferase